MIKQVLEQMNAAVFAELALLMFAIIFVAIVARTLLTRSETTNRQANIVFGDNAEDQA